MICCGIESTAHTFGCAIVSDEGGKCNILSNEKDSYATTEGGMVPRELASHHYGCAKRVIEGALEKAKMKMREVDLVAFSQGPGMGPALSVGAVAARALALANKKPLLG